MGWLLTGHYFVKDYGHEAACIQLSKLKQIKPSKCSKSLNDHNPRNYGRNIQNKV